MAKIPRIHHIGIAVNNLNEALPFWVEGLGLELDQIETVARQKSKVAFLPIGASDIELVMPDTDDSTLKKFLAE